MFPPVGVNVRLLRGSLSAKGVFAWQGNRQGGVNFDHQIDVSLWVRRVAHAGQQRVDAVIDTIRRRDAKSDHLQNEPVRETLTTISAALDEVCERLSGTANMSVEFAEDLLRLKAISHSLRNVARSRKI